MVAIVSGNTLGLSLTSLATLGAQGSVGSGRIGQGGEQAFVNAATGNLVLQTRDDHFASVGGDIDIVRTYNSAGLTSDSWRVGVERQRIEVDANGDLLRIDFDGAAGRYKGTAQTGYRTSDGGGADDRIEIVGGEYKWTDGATEATEWYDLATAQLLRSKDVDQNTTTYSYTSGNPSRLQTVTSQSGDVVTYNYNGSGQLASISTAVSGIGTSSRVSYQYDTNGRLKIVTVDLTPANTADTKTYTTTYTYAYEAAGMGWRETSQTGVHNGHGQTGTVLTTYDKNGHIASVDDSVNENDRTFKTDQQGRVLYVNQGNHVQRQMVVNGEVMGRFGEAVDDDKARQQGVPSFKSIADFGFGYTSTAGDTPSVQTQTHTVGSGDTMQSIAQMYYGDSRLWYRIAEANSISSNAELHAGQALRVPGTEASGNAANTFKPYDPSAVIGDKTPFVPMPKKSSNWFAQLLMVVVAIIVTIYTAGVASMGLNGAMQAGFAGTMSAGSTAIGAGITGGAMGISGGTTFAVGTTGLTGTTLGAGGFAAAGAAGSLASQVVGVATGVQDSISWKGVAMGAASSVVGGSLANVNFMGSGPLNSASNTIVRAAVGNTLTQGIGVATGLQNRFDWRSVAASAVGAGVGHAVGPALGNAFDRAFEGSPNAAMFATRVTTGLVAGTAAAVARGGKVAIQQVAVDAFGNSLAYSLADAASGATSDQRGAAEAVQLSDAVYGGSEAVSAPYTGMGLQVGRTLGLQATSSNVVSWNTSVDQRSAEGAQTLDVAHAGGGAADKLVSQDDALSKYELYRPGLNDAYGELTANGGGYQYDPRRAGAAVQGLLRRADKFLDGVARWSSEQVGPAFDSAILDAASSGQDNWGRFLTGARVVATASSDAVSGTAALGRLFVSPEARDAFADSVGSFLQDPAGSVSRAFNAWTSKAWHEQLEDVYKVFQSGAAGIGLVGKAKSLFAVRVLDDFADLGPNTKQVLSAYQSAYNDGAAAFESKLAAQSITKPDRLNFNTWAGGQIDQFARDEMLTFKQLSGMDDLIVNKRMYVTDGIKNFRIPDLILPSERTVIDGTIGTKSLTTPQIQDFFNSGKVDRVILVAPNQKPVIITLEQYLRSKK